jgi:hypothetical protein
MPVKIYWLHNFKNGSRPGITARIKKVPQIIDLQYLKSGGGDEAPIEHLTTLLRLIQTLKSNKNQSVTNSLQMTGTKCLLVGVC